MSDLIKKKKKHGAALLQTAVSRCCVRKKSVFAVRIYGT